MKSNPQTSTAIEWRPEGRGAWVLTLTACILAVITAIVAYYVQTPVNWDGLGKFGAIALLFPLHLLVVTLLATVMGWLALRRGISLATAAFGLVAMLTAFSAMWPTMLVWRMARQAQVSLSLGDYAANALHLNIGRPQPERSVVYGTASDGTKLELDVWRTGQPNTGPLRPAIVYIHGGAWSHGNRSMLPDWNRWLNKLGYEVFDVEYRLAPPARWQDEVGDVKCALGWVSAHAADYGVDSSRISTMGGSAGGNLSMLAAYSMGNPQLPPSCDVPAVAVRSVVNLYGPADLVLGYSSSGSLGYVQNALRQYIGGSPQEYPDRYQALSPVNHINANTPPTITIIGTSDRIVPLNQAFVLNQALSKAGVIHETYLLPANDHGFDVNWGGFGTQIARAKIKAFLESAAEASTQRPPQDTAGGLGGTSWQLVKFQGSDGTVLVPDDKTKYTIAFGTDGNASVRFDCNRGRSAWKSSGQNQLQFGLLALTRAACPPGSLHDQMVKHWEFIWSYIIKDGHLFLSLMADGGVYEFEPLPALNS